MSESAPGRRRYDTAGRRAAAEQRRQRVLDEAARLFAADGWSATTVARIAEAADVSPELVTSAFGTKGGVLIAAVARTYTDGRHQLGPALAARRLETVPDPTQRLDAVVDLVCGLQPQVAPLVPAVRQAADHDAQIGRRLQAALTGHLQACGRVVELLATGPVRAEAVDEVYLATVVDPYLILVERRGWSLEAYAGWVRRALTAAVAPA